ncbi:MAG TPA: adenosylcobinamide-GDP ribazoletransferase, partial [Pseudomonadales bacterium]|nr:adenosylcobinamide-GDP ribazoletransferase [Pseudomonadales bacterium]
MNALWIALRFLTRLPAPEPHYNEASMAHSIQFYGWIGVLIGALVCLPQIALSPPPLLSAAILVALMQWLTGGLHADGLTDCADAWVGGRDKDHTLRIMKDPHIGAMGVNALVCVLLIQFSAVTTLAHTSQLILCLCVTCACSRSAAAWLLLLTP